MRSRVGTKLLLGYAAMIALIVIPAAGMVWWLQRVQMIQAHVLEVSQPSVAAAKGIREGMHQSQAGLRGYMALGSEPFKAQRRQGRQKAETELNALTTLAELWPPEQRRMLKRLRTELGDLDKIHRSVEEICQQDENLPGIKQLVYDVSPLGERMLSALNDIIRIESVLEKTPQRRQLMNELTDLRTSMQTALVEMHGYLITANSRHIENYQKRWNGSRNTMANLQSSRRLFTPKQSERFEDLLRLRSKFAPLPEQLFAIRDSDAWNLANQQLVQQAAPREAQASDLLNQIISNQENKAGQARQSLEIRSAYLNALVMGGPGIAAILGIFIGWSATRRVTRPLHQTVAALEAVAGGDSSRRLRIEGKDEFTRMAMAINTLAETIQAGSATNETLKVNLDPHRLRNFVDAEISRCRPHIELVSSSLPAQPDESQPWQRSCAVFEDMISQVVATADQLTADSQMIMERSQLLSRESVWIESPQEPASEKPIEDATAIGDETRTTAAGSQQEARQTAASLNKPLETKLGFRQQLADDTRRLASGSEQLRSQATKLTQLMNRLQSGLPLSGADKMQEQTIPSEFAEAHAAEKGVHTPSGSSAAKHATNKS